MYLVCLVNQRVQLKLKVTQQIFNGSKFFSCNGTSLDLNFASQSLGQFLVKDQLIISRSFKQDLHWPELLAQLTAHYKNRSFEACQGLLCQNQPLLTEV